MNTLHVFDPPYAYPQYVVTGLEFDDSSDFVDADADDADVMFDSAPGQFPCAFYSVWLVDPEGRDGQGLFDCVFTVWGTLHRIVAQYRTYEQAAAEALRLQQATGLPLEVPQ